MRYALLIHERPGAYEGLEHSPFHARRLGGIDLAAVDPGDLSLLPVMTKTAMMDGFDDLVTDRRLTRRAGEQALDAAGPAPATPLGTYLALTSGGSSGDCGIFVLDVPGPCSSSARSPGAWWPASPRPADHHPEGSRSR